MIMPNWWYIWAAAGHDPLGLLGEPKTLWNIPNLDENKTDTEKAKERKDDIKFVLKLIVFGVVNAGLAVTTLLLCNRYYYKKHHKKSQQKLEKKVPNVSTSNNKVIDWYSAQNNQKCRSI